MGNKQVLLEYKSTDQLAHISKNVGFSGSSTILFSATKVAIYSVDATTLINNNLGVVQN